MKEKIGEKVNFFEFKPSKWKCELFGMKNYYWRPFEGDEPNWFWRWMQYLLLGNRWIKDKGE